MSIYLADEILLAGIGAPPEGEEVHGDPRLRRIAVDDGFRGGTITASGTMSGHFAANVANGLTFDFWRPPAGGASWVAATFATSRVLNYMGVAAHDLHLRGGTVTAQVLLADVWTDAADPYTPPDGAPFVIPFADWQTTAAARLLVSADSAPYIGVVQAGRMVTVPHGAVADGMVPFRQSRVTEREGIWSEAGALLGVTVKRLGAEVAVDLPLIPAEWMDANWLPLVILMERYPFFVVNNGLSWGLRDVIYGVLVGDPRPPYEQYLYQSVTLPMRGITA